MKPQALVTRVLLVLLTHLSGAASAARKPANSVLLSNVKTLTLRQDQLTTARRVSPIPQLQCVGGNARGLYEIDVLRCTNSGSDYDEDNVQWTCKASLPPEFKLGSTEVICEGYDSPEDPYILKGSCGVEYRLVLTAAGEEKYGHRDDDSDYGSGGKTSFDRIMFGLCLTFIVGVVVYGIWDNCTGRNTRRPNDGPGHRGGWWGGDDDDNDPPPPYTPRAPPNWKKSSQASQSQGWRPGFWTGAAAGAGAAAAAGYMNGGRNSGRRTDPMTGSSRWAERRGGSGASSPGSAAPSTSRYESTGFGGTSRR